MRQPTHSPPCGRSLSLYRHGRLKPGILRVDGLQFLSDELLDLWNQYGIHLITCYFIIHHHGGTIEAKGNEGQGTTFTISLPLNPAAAPQGEGEQDFLKKAVLNDNLWRELLTS